MPPSLMLQKISGVTFINFRDRASILEAILEKGAKLREKRDKELEQYNFDAEAERVQMTEYLKTLHK